MQVRRRGRKSEMGFGWEDIWMWLWGWSLRARMLGDFLRFSFVFRSGGIMSRLIFRLPTQCSQIN